MMHGVVRIAAPVIGAHVEVIEEALLGIDDGEIQAQQAGALAQVDDAAINVVVAADAGEAVAEIDRASQIHGSAKGCGEAAGSGAGICAACWPSRGIATNKANPSLI